MMNIPQKKKFFLQMSQNIMPARLYYRKRH